MLCDLATNALRVIHLLLQATVVDAAGQCRSCKVLAGGNCEIAAGALSAWQPETVRPHFVPAPASEIASKEIPVLRQPHHHQKS